MKQYLALTAIVVEDYDEALAFYVDLLGFELIEDSVVIGAPTGLSASFNFCTITLYCTVLPLLPLLSSLYIPFGA